MRKIVVKIILIILGGTHFPVSAEGICTAGEAAIFNCDLRGGAASLCESNGDGALTYRHKTRNSIDLEISDGDGRSEQVFYFSSTPYAGGGEAHIRFAKGGYTYFLYDKTVKTEEGPDSSAGIVVYKGNMNTATYVCTNDASIRQSVYQRNKMERYKDILKNSRVDR
ncbi:hypothetical protein [Cupriavidus pauculus]|uniref:hypothetical protein n=1 Tax=Cupriavidus pauculus TaxID=82633 RepID=UPI001FD3C90D|nr:hypothetical protein [Cupriavidus pauculus]